jgi:hypothetical protein
MSIIQYPVQMNFTNFHHDIKYIMMFVLKRNSDYYYDPFTQNIDKEILFQECYVQSESFVMMHVIVLFTLFLALLNFFMMYFIFDMTNINIKFYHLRYAFLSVFIMYCVHSFMRVTLCYNINKDDEYFFETLVVVNATHPKSLSPFLLS